jgi:major membrane immunogen (membrane-anchored lipoprotein)
MKNIFFSILITGLAVFMMNGCDREQKSDLELIKAYHPEDKYFKSSLVSLHYVIETSPISRVDTTFGQLVDSYDLPFTAKGIPDGNYTGESPYDAFDFKHIVSITVEDEKIVAIDYNEVHKDGMGKEEDEEYCQEMSITGTTPAIAYPNMESQMLQKQDMLQVDATSGATYSLYRFRYALTVAFMKGLIAANQA